ncbi:MAG: phosphoribosylaminoimidazolesuccinocarboxamide synthase [Chloroflexi bacterium]|nr:phosphoribosylaminoimidazolesuccinocarboxamide synthase [Chloroflexota bacterium]
MLTATPALPLFRRGKVREMYAVDDNRLLMVASDRVSAFDVVMAEPIPGKGSVLTALSAFWFRATADLVRNHLISDRLEDLPAAVREVEPAIHGRWLLVRRADRIDLECVVRGYLAGSAWAEYRRSGTVAEEPLPGEQVEAQRLDAPIFTPAIKAETGHDENISRARFASMVGAERARQLEELSLKLYAAGADHAASRGLILADTKFEFGTVDDGEVMLIDEALTPDSSRYWPADQYAPGRPQPSFDKQFLRDFLESSGWNKEPPPPRLPPEVIAGTAARYAEALRRLTA